MTSRRGAVIAGAVAAGALLAGTVLVLNLGGDDASQTTSSDAPTASGPSRQDIAVVARQAGVGSPRRPELPELEDREAVVAFLDGDGAKLIDVHASLVGVLSDAPPSTPECEAVAVELDAVFAPAELYAVAAEVPDPATSELFVNLAASTNRFLAACREGDEALRGELAYHWVLVDRRLEELDAAS